jgi:glycosyltransferase involved in cell wall biosynthesis
MKKVLVITGHPAPYWTKALVELNKVSNVSVIYIKENVPSKPWKNQKYFPGLIYSFKNIFLIINQIFSADQIILGGIYLRQLRTLLLISILLIKKVALFSDVPEVRKRSRFLIFFKKQLYKLFNLFLISGYKGMELYESLYDINKNKILYFPYAWDECDSRETNFNERPFKIFISNRFLERKGYDILLKSILILKKKGVLNDFQFTIAGDGPLFEKYKNEFQKINKLKCVFKGWINYKEYIYELNNCHIYIHTSKFEPFGIPVVDALYRGKIVISSNGVMSANDFIINGKNGFVYDSNDFIELAKIIEKISKNTFNLNAISKIASNDLKNYSNYLTAFSEKINK